MEQDERRVRPHTKDSSNRGIWDVVIVGGGPAGLSAALMLGRCRRRVLLIDSHQPRNAGAARAHGVFSRDGTPPQKLRRVARSQLRPYGVVVSNGWVTSARRLREGFAVRTVARQYRCRKLILATGIVDIRPEVPGTAQFYGRSIWPCPLCDGWEARDKPLAAYGRGRAAVEFALSLTTWSDDVLLLTDGGRLDAGARRLLRRGGVKWRTDRVAAFRGIRGSLRAIEFTTGERLLRSALFFHLGIRQRSDLAAQLGCEFTRSGTVRTRNRGEKTGIPGLYVVGDASHDTMLIAVAAAEGVKAATAANRELRLIGTRPCR